MKKWIWQHKNYPNFKYSKDKLINLLNKIEYKKGVIDGICQFFSKDDIRKIEIETLTDEAINTSLIEGEVFERKSVRSSIRKKLDKNFEDDKYSTEITDALSEIFFDCNLNKTPLTIDRLHGWHNCLFENNYSRLNKINVAKFREEKMEVVSGAIGNEKIHYQAPPAEIIESEMERFLKYVNNSDENIYIKSAISHLWFVIIHPYDDGNGRIARAITDYILSQNKNTEFKLYSISTAIKQNRKEYYEILDKTTNLFRNREFDITSWIEWHLKILNQAIDLAIQNIQFIVKKTKFWDKCRTKPLNERQLKVLNKIVDINFEGYLTTKKYISITKTSKATAVRDIKQLLEYKCIKQVENSSGRNVKYEIIFGIE